MDKYNGYGKPFDASETPGPSTQSTELRPLQRLPKGCLYVVLGWTLTLFFIHRWHSIPIWIVSVSYGAPVIGILALSYHISQQTDHTKNDKRRLWTFFLSSYIIGTGAYLYTSIHSVDVYSQADMGGTVPVYSGVEDSILINGASLVLIILGLAGGLSIVSGVSPSKRPLPYIGLFAGVALFVFLLVPFPNSMSGDEIPEIARNEIPWDEERNFMWVVPLWEYYLTRREISFEGVIIQLSMAISALILGSVWSLFRPIEFRNTFGLPSPMKGEDELKGSQAEKEPEVRIFKP